MKIVRRSAAGILGCLLLLPSVARTAPADASSPPRASGPLVGAPIPCEDDGAAEPGEVKGQSCSWSYELLPVETSPQEDFWVYWFQLEITPGKGECAKGLSFHMTIPDGGRIISAAPERSSRLSRYTESVTRLEVDGEGTAPVAGAIEQDVALGKGRTEVRLTPEGYSFEWWGNSRKKVMAAIGVQLSRNAAPPELLSTWSEGGGFGSGSCRPLVARIGPD